MKKLDLTLLGATREVSEGRDDSSKPSPLFDNSVHGSRFVTCAELAAVLSVSIHTIHKWRAQGRIVPKKFGRSVRFVVAEVVATLTEKGRKHREIKKR